MSSVCPFISTYHGYSICHGYYAYTCLHSHVLNSLVPTQADDTLALMQHQTKLYLANVTHLSHDLFYQLVRARHRNGNRAVSVCQDHSRDAYMN